MILFVNGNKVSFDKDSSGLSFDEKCHFHVHFAIELIDFVSLGDPQNWVKCQLR